LKFKYYIRGIGIGIIFTTIILAVSFYINGGSKKITDVEVIERAKSLGMEFLSTEDMEAESQTTLTEAEETTPEASSMVGETQTEVETEQGPLVIEVEKGMIWRDIAKILAEEKIIPNEDEFWEYVYRNARRKDIYVGTYEVPRDADFDTIIEIFTTQKKDNS